MSAGFFLTATNKLGIPVASDSDHTTDYDSDEEREIERRKKILEARKKANPLHKVFQDSKNKNSDLPNPISEMKKAQVEHGTHDKKINWLTFGEDAKKTGLVTRYTPPTLEQLQQRRKEKENGKFEYNLASKDINKKDLTSEEFRMLHHGKEKIEKYKKKTVQEVIAKGRPDIEDEYQAILNDEKKWRNRLEKDFGGGKDKKKVKRRGGAPYQRNRYNRNENGAWHRTNFEFDAPQAKNDDGSDDNSDSGPGFTMEDLLEPAN